MPKGYFTPYTKEQEDFIKAEYLNKPVKRIAVETNSTYGRVMRFLKKNNLSIPKELIKQRIQDSYKKKGSVPFNKGKRQAEYMTPEVIEKCKNTRFKKGNKPHNTKEKGVVVERLEADGRIYRYIKIADSNWELYHRYLWEQKNGSAPKGSVIAFKDGNTNNLKIENLEMVTREDMMDRNTIHRYPKDLKENLRLLSKIKKELKNI